MFEKGQEFNDWTIICKDETRKQHCICKCVCGTIKSIYRYNLISNKSRCCGCRPPVIKNPSSEYSRHELYGTWNKMCKRCDSPENSSYKNYGARGISVCDKWRNSFLSFVEDMGPKPTPKHTVDRIDNNGNYCPENCRWATPKEQGRNTRKNRFLTFKGNKKTISEWAEELDISESTLRCRLDRFGWTIKKALTTPPDEDNYNRKKLKEKLVNEGE